MHRQDRLRVGRDGRLNLRRIDVERGVINVHVHRFGARVRNRPARGYKSKWRGDDLIARADVQDSHRRVQGGSAAVETQAMLGFAEFGEIFLELDYGRAEAEGTV